MSNLGNKAIMAENIQHYMNINSKSRQEVCDAIAVKYTTFTDWVKGNTYPRIDKIELMANYFGISKSDLVEDHRKSLSTNPRTVKIYGRIAGGTPIEMIEDVIDEVDLTTIPVKPGQKYFGLKISGHSMEPDIKDGDYIICLQANDAESGSIVAATVNGDDATCKRLMKYPDGIRLLPINPSYDAKYYTNREVEELPVRVIGIVIESRHRYR